MKTKIQLILMMLVFSVLSYFGFAEYARENNYGSGHIIGFTVFIIFLIFIFVFGWINSNDNPESAATNSGMEIDDDEEARNMEFDDSDTAAYRILWGDNTEILESEFEKAWQDDEKVIDLIEKNYSLISREPLAQVYLFKRLMRYDMSDSDERLEKDLLLIKKLISQERPHLGEFVPVFFDDLYHIVEGDTFWDGYFGDLSIEIIKWLEGNPYRYALYKFWNETCGVDTYSEGEITEEDFDGYHSELRTIYKAAKGDYRLAEKKLAELEPDSLEYTLFKKLQKHAGEHLEYYNIG